MVVHFNPQKREFSLLLNIPCPPYSMLGCNRTITRTNINVLLNIGPGVGGGRKKRGRKSNLPNTFDNDCRFILLDIVQCNNYCMHARWLCCVDKRHSALVTVL